MPQQLPEEPGAAPADPLDHDGDGRRGGSLPHRLGRSVHAAGPDVWVVLTGDGEAGPRGAVRRLPPVAARRLVAAGEARPATAIDFGIAGIDPGRRRPDEPRPGPEHRAKED